MSESVSEVETSKETTPIRWEFPAEAVVTKQNVQSRAELTKTEGGEGIYDFSLCTEPGADSAAIEFVLGGVSLENSVVITSGWHSWAGRETRGKTVGIATLAERMQAKKTTFVVEPGRGGEETAAGEGRSYGLIDFRLSDGSTDVVLGVMPSFEGIEDIRFKQEGPDMIVKVTRKLEGVESARETHFRVLAAQGSYIDLIDRFSSELGKLTGEVKPMKDRVIGFSWAAYGKGVTQTDIENEIAAGTGIFDTYIIDDGWQKVAGQWEVRIDKFPDIIGLAQKMKEKGIRPGIWIAPFMVMRESEVYRQHPGWIMRDGKGRELAVSNPQIQPTGELTPIAEKAKGLDISIPEVREHLYEEFTRLSKMGFDVFKADFISIPFLGKLKNNDKTSVEYYRQFFKELRERIRERAGKEIEIIGCGAPLMESIGLFEGMRMTPDSAMPNMEKLPNYGGVLSWIKDKPAVGSFVSKVFEKIDSTLYRDAAAVAFRRALIFGKAHGLLIDGVHLNDPALHVNPDLKEKIAMSLPALKRLGVVSSLFVGDSLARVGEQGRQVWKHFLDKFKKGENIKRDELKLS